MIRRKFIFADHTAKKLYASPEFNGSMEEYQARSASLDACDLSVLELQKLFPVNSLDAFNKACEAAQSHCHSFLGSHTHVPAVEVSLDQLCSLQTDETIFVINLAVSCSLNWSGMCAFPSALSALPCQTVVMAMALDMCMECASPHGVMTYSKYIRQKISHGWKLKSDKLSSRKQTLSFRKDGLP